MEAITQLEYYPHKWINSWLSGRSQQVVLDGLQINQNEKVQRTAARWTCRRWRNTSSVGKMLDELELPSFEARRDQSSLLLFHKIRCGAVSIEKKVKQMTPAHSLKT